MTFVSVSPGFMTRLATPVFPGIMPSVNIMGFGYRLVLYTDKEIQQEEDKDSYQPKHRIGFRYTLPSQDSPKLCKDRLKTSSFSSEVPPLQIRLAKFKINIVRYAATVAPNIITGKFKSKSKLKLELSKQSK